jgi:hypothetical protein
LLFLAGTAVGAYNIWMTMRAVPATAGTQADRPEPSRPILQAGE